MSKTQTALTDHGTPSGSGGRGDRDENIWDLFNITQKPLYNNPALIRRLHVHELLDQQESADLLGCGRTTLRRRLDEYDIQRPWRDSDVLWELYWDKYHSTREIAKIVSCGASTIKRKLRQNEIPLRENKNGMVEAPFEMDVRGYEQWRTTVDGRQVVVRLHRLLAASIYGLDEIDGMVVHHKNGLRWDNRPDNLELMTNSDHARLHNTKEE